MSMESILLLAISGEGVTIAEHDGTWYFIERGKFPSVTECESESEALALRDEAEAVDHRPGCRCNYCPMSLPERSEKREWA